MIYAFVAFYVLFNIFIIGMIWYPPDKQGAINSYVTPGVSTGLIIFGILYWVLFAKVTPALGYQIEDEEEGLLDTHPYPLIKALSLHFPHPSRTKANLHRPPNRTSRRNPLGNLQSSSLPSSSSPLPPPNLEKNQIDPKTEIQNRPRRTLRCMVEIEILVAT